MAEAVPSSSGEPGCASSESCNSQYPCPLPPPALPEGLQDSREKPLVMCLKREDFELAFLLLTKGADPRNISITEGDTPLHAALHIFLDTKCKPLFLKQSFP